MCGATAANRAGRRLSPTSVVRLDLVPELATEPAYCQAQRLRTERERARFARQQCDGEPAASDERACQRRSRLGVGAQDVEQRVEHRRQDAVLAQLLDEVLNLGA